MPSDSVVVAAPESVGSAEEQQQKQYQLVNRVLNYPTVTQLVDVTKGYYTSAKDYSPLVKSVSENLEQRLDSTAKLYNEKVAPSVTPVLTSVTPVLASVDGFGCRQLDRFEHLGQVYQNSKENLSNKVVQYKKDGKEFGNAAVPALDNFLASTPYLSPVLLKALDVSETLAEKYLPATENNQEKEKGKEEQAVGPVYRAANLTLRVSSGLSVGLSDLKAKTPEAKQKSLKYVLDLVHQARENLDSGVQNANQFLLGNLPSNLGEVSKKVQGFTSESLKSLLDAVTLLSDKLPENLKEKSTKTLQELSSRKELVAFTDVLKANAVKLQSATESLSEYIKKNEKLPSQLASVADALNNVLESLLNKPTKRVEAQQ